MIRRLGHLQKAAGLAASLLLLSSCGKTEFNGGSSTQRATLGAPKTDQPQSDDAQAQADSTPLPSSVNSQQPSQPAVEKSLALTCDDHEASVHELRYQAGESIRLSLTGQICAPRKQEILTVVFVVDNSSSTGGWGGTDIFNGQTCGRFEALTSVIEVLQTNLAAYEGIDVRVVRFATDASSLQPVRLNGDKPYNYFRASEICSSDGRTDYGDAFQVAAEELADSADGKKLLYFLSDGAPDPGTDSKARAISASLHTIYGGDLAMRAVLLGDGGADASQLLADLTGGPENVKHASTASELPKQILDFNLAEYRSDSISVHITELEQDVKVLEVNESNGVWQWSSEAVSLVPDMPASHHIIIRATDSAGETSERTVVVTLIKES